MHGDFLRLLFSHNLTLPLTQSLSPPRSLVCDGQTSPLLWYVPSSRYIWSSAPIFCFCKKK
jgi:hypothetical protein